MRQINLLIKPASSLCNMRCKYCFYADEAQARAVANLGIMSEDTMESLLCSVRDALDSSGEVSFSFQGGEPTMAGLDFFQNFVEQANLLLPSRIRRNYAIQTNGYCIDEAWADFFAQNHFLVGLSLDGDNALHDAWRVDAAGKGTYGKVVKALELLRQKRVDMNLLCVVTGLCARHPQRVYKAMKGLGVHYLQFIPCLDPLEQPRGSLPFSLKPAAYGSFLCGLFDEWYRDWAAGHYVSIRLFDDYVHLAMGVPCGTCSTSGSCGSYLVVEGDGSVYPCDFYCIDRWKLGNIREQTVVELLESKPAKQFLAESQQRPEVCADCSWFALCHGGCKRDRWIAPDGAFYNYYCDAYRRLFSYAAPRLRTIAQAEWRARRGY